MARARQIRGDNGDPVDIIDDYGTAYGPKMGEQPQGPLGPVEAPPYQAPDEGGSPGSGQGGEGGGNPTPPRENPNYNPPLRPLGEGQATPPRPMEPTPQAGASGPAMPGVFPPMPGPGLESLTSPRRRGLLGGMGGLTEGGLGVPGGTSQGPDQISALIQQLLMNRGS